MRAQPMPASTAMEIIIKEYRKAKKTGKRMPIHSTSQAGRVIEAAARIMDVAMRKKYGPLKERLVGEDALNAMKETVAQTAVACIRLLEKLEPSTKSSIKKAQYVIHQDQAGKAD